MIRVERKRILVDPITLDLLNRSLGAVQPVIVTPELKESIAPAIPLYSIVAQRDFAIEVRGGEVKEAAGVRIFSEDIFMRKFWVIDVPDALEIAVMLGKPQGNELYSLFMSGKLRPEVRVVVTNVEGNATMGGVRLDNVPAEFGRVIGGFLGEIDGRVEGYVVYQLHPN